MKIPSNRDARTTRNDCTKRVAAVRLVTDHLAVIAEIANRFAVMYAGRIDEPCPWITILEDRHNPPSFAVRHE